VIRDHWPLHPSFSQLNSGIGAANSNQSSGGISSRIISKLNSNPTSHSTAFSSTTHIPSNASVDTSVQLAPSEGIRIPRPTFENYFWNRDHDFNRPYNIGVKNRPEAVSAAYYKYFNEQGNQGVFTDAESIIQLRSTIKDLIIKLNNVDNKGYKLTISDIAQLKFILSSRDFGYIDSEIRGLYNADRLEIGRNNVSTLLNTNGKSFRKIVKGHLYEILNGIKRG
jgi:hypothetical protein